MDCLVLALRFGEVREVLVVKVGAVEPVERPVSLKVSLPESI